MEVDCGEIPLCDSCGHRHIQGVRCTICGHVGKSQIFVKMRHKAQEGRSIKVECIEQAYNHLTDGYIDAHSPLNVVLHLKKQIVQQIGLPHKDVFDVRAEIQFDHVLCSAGDCPVATARWHSYQNSSGDWGVSISHVMCLAEWRGSKLAYRCLYSALLTASKSGVSFGFLEVQVPQIPGSEWVWDKLKCLGFIEAQHLASQSWCGVPVGALQLTLTPTSAAGGSSNLEEMINYLSQKLV